MELLFNLRNRPEWADKELALDEEAQAEANKKKQKTESADWN